MRCLHRKKILFIQSTLRLKGDLTSTGLKDNLNEYNSFFKLEGKVFIFSKLFRISFLMIYISRILKKNVTLFHRNVIQT